MWTVRIFKALVLMLRTLPQLAVRSLVFAGIAVGLALACFAGAWLGYRLGLAGGSADPSTDAVLAGFGSLALGAGLVAVWRDRLLHAVQARSIALMVDSLAGRRLPLGLGQIALARTAVTSRLGTRTDLHDLDRLIRGVSALVPSVAEGLGPVQTLPGMGRLASGGLVERVILAQAYRARPENAWEAAHDALVLYTQNARPLLATAGWITLVGWLATVGLFLLFLGPMSGFAALWPGEGQAGTLVLAGLSAWAIRAALIEPFAFACLMQAFLQITAGQDPLPEWRGRLTQVCDRFRQLGERAVTREPASGAEI
ncbi:MAG: hypothetical protein V4753_06215 [Pseudomonadota bacterium]